MNTVSHAVGGFVCRCACADHFGRFDLCGEQAELGKGLQKVEKWPGAAIF